MSTHTVLQFKHAIESIDSLSQLGFSRISSIAKLALMALESPEQYPRTPEDIRNALKAIADTACDFENCINSEAEAMNCDHKSDDHVNQWTPESASTARVAL